MTPELSHPIRPALIPAAGEILIIEASEAERAALARRFGLPAIHALRAELDLRPTHGGRVRVTGRLRAELEQSCVISLDPFAQTIETPLDWLILPPGETPSEEGHAELDGPDEVECEGDVADLGEALAQSLSLALDPYPRKPGAALPAAAGPQAMSPFATLAKWRPTE
jgi:hypothetical protein